MHLFNRYLCIKTSETMFARAKQCLREGNEVEFCSSLIYLMLVSPLAKRLTGFSSVSVFVRWNAACLKITVTKKKWWCYIRLNRHVTPWSNVSFIAKHSEMIKIFRFTKNHKGIEYSGGRGPFSLPLWFSLYSPKMADPLSLIFTDFNYKGIRSILSYFGLGFTRNFSNFITF